MPHKIWYPLRLRARILIGRQVPLIRAATLWLSFATLISKEILRFVQILPWRRWGKVLGLEEVGFLILLTICFLGWSFEMVALA